MAKLLHLRRIGIADDPAGLQPTLADCLSAIVGQAELLVPHVLEGLRVASQEGGSRRMPAVQQARVRDAVAALREVEAEIKARFTQELSSRVYLGGGSSDEQPAQMLRFDDLQLLGEAELDDNIELARARQEVARAVDDVLPEVDALISTLMGWRTTQAELNPLRPDVFIRALQAAMWSRVPDVSAREALVLPSAGLLGVQLHRAYRELADWLRSTGIEPAVAPGGRKDRHGLAASPVTKSVARTLLTLDRLRKLLAGEFDAPRAPGEFLHTVPASLALLQELKQVDALVERLEQEKKSAPPPSQPAPPVDMLADGGAAAAAPRLGEQLGVQVVRLMFDNLGSDGRLVAAYKQALRTLEPSVIALARCDSRFFSERRHPARQLLERMTQRSLGYTNESDEGWQRFLSSVERAAARLADEPQAEADHFAQVLESLEAAWADHDEALRLRRAEAAKALLQAEQRNLLAQRLAGEFEQALAGTDLPEFIADFLKTSWSQVLAHAKLSMVDGSDDPHGYRALVEDLAWSVQPLAAHRAGGLSRLAYLVPGLVARLREGLQRIDYPAEMTERFFERLGAIHASLLKEGRDAAVQRAAQQAQVEPSEFGPDAFPDSGVWLAGSEARDAGFLGDDSVSPSPSPDSAAPPDSIAPQGDTGLAIGTWVELSVRGQSRRVQLSWASPHQTLFMFTAPSGSAHSMSRRTLDRLRATGQLTIVGRNLVDQALDEVAQAALRNTVG